MLHSFGDAGVGRCLQALSYIPRTMHAISVVSEKYFK